jgi:hypothetical protein
LVFFKHLKLIPHANPLISLKIHLRDGTKIDRTDLTVTVQKHNTVLCKYIGPWRCLKHRHVSDDECLLVNIERKRTFLED